MRKRNGGRGREEERGRKGERKEERKEGVDKWEQGGREQSMNIDLSAS